MVFSCCVRLFCFNQMQLNRWKQISLLEFILFFFFYFRTTKWFYLWFHRHMSTHTGAHARTMICRKLLLNDDVTSMLSHNLSGSVDRSFQHSKHSNWSILPGRIRCKNVQQFFSFILLFSGFYHCSRHICKITKWNVEFWKEEWKKNCRLARKVETWKGRKQLKSNERFELRKRTKPMKPIRPRMFPKTIEQRIVSARIKSQKMWNVISVRFLFVLIDFIFAFRRSIDRVIWDILYGTKPKN